MDSTQTVHAPPVEVRNARADLIDQLTELYKRTEATARDLQRDPGAISDRGWYAPDPTDEQDKP